MALYGDTRIPSVCLETMIWNLHLFVGGGGACTNRSLVDARAANCWSVDHFDAE